jgi:hypothetical protein
VIELDGIFGLALLALWIFCVFDVIAADETLVRHLPKMFWLMIVLFIPDIGAIAWLLLGRPEGAAWTPGSTDYRKTRRPVGVEDDPGWAPSSSPSSPPPARDEKAEFLEAWEADLQRREEQIRRQPPDDPTR